jgi:hypothetical protein
MYNYNSMVFQAGIPSGKITVVEEAAAAFCFCMQSPLQGFPKPKQNEERIYVFVECEGRYTHA